MSHVSSAGPLRQSLEIHLGRFARSFPADTHAACCLDLLRSTPEPCSRSQFHPGHFTASACVVSPDGFVLMLHHAKLDLWLQPGGHIEREDPSPLAAARREVDEECGLSELEVVLRAGEAGPIDVDVHVIPPWRDEPLHRHFDLRYGFRTTRETPLVSTGESRDVRWIARSELSRYTRDPGIERMLGRLERARPHAEP